MYNNITILIALPLALVSSIYAANSNPGVLKYSYRVLSRALLIGLPLTVLKKMEP